MALSSADPTATPESNPFRALPSVSAIIDILGDVPVSPAILTELIRADLAEIRQEIEQGKPFERSDVIARCRTSIDELLGTRLQPVINGTGIVLHTNLGRAPVSAATAAAMAETAASYLSLELDPASNRRGGRMDEVSRLMRALTGAEATLVVNNNAAAVLLTLAALGAGKEVIVSRGESVEIGGGFRIPDVIAQSGCRLIDVGTTNRTYVADYRRAASGETAALLKVHASNFTVEGFTAGVSTAELATLAGTLGVPLIEDLGSGALLDMEQFGLRHEPTVREAIEAGASVVTMSGDKLLGGPQAGIIAGRRDLLQAIERHPLARALRVDKVTLAGICATLRHYIKGSAESEVPIWRMIGASLDELRRRATPIADELELEIVDSIASIGGGSLPGESLPSIALRIESDRADDLAKRLRTGNPPVFPYVRDGAVLIDLRTVQESQDAALRAAIRQATN